MAEPALPTEPDSIALFLDLDGTLIELAPTPETVHVPQDLAPLLALLHDRLQGALALISGRPLAELDRLLAPLRLAGAGAHGGEYRLQADGPIEQATIPLPPGLIASATAELAAITGVVLEDKSSVLAIHYRAAPDAEPQVIALLRPLAAAWDLDLVLGKMVAELRPRGVDKGAAIEHLMDRPPFAGRIPVFVGDDTTDEDGFRAVDRMGGFALHVGVERAAPGQLTFEGPQAVRAWLASLLKTETPRA